MTKPFHLQSLLDLSNNRLDEAARKLGRLIANEQEASQRVKLLTEYREEYQTRFLASASDGMNPDAWRNYQHFLGRLDQAVEQARTMAATSKQQTASGQRIWLDKRGKVKAFDTLAERHQTRETATELRYEQKAADEHTARRFGITSEEE